MNAESLCTAAAIRLVRNDMRNKKIIFGILSAIIIIAGSNFFLYRITSSPKACSLPDYASYNGPAEDLLILEGNCVIPTAIEAIQDRTLPKRPFVISFLGNSDHKEALESLVKIVEDATDSDRTNAIIAVFRIDNEKGRELAMKYEKQQNELGKYSRDVLANKEYLHNRKTYWQAWRSYISITYAL
jgi:hypothetical protein